MFERKIGRSLYRGLFHEPTSTMEEQLELDKRQTELLKRNAAEIATRANSAEENRKQWLDVGAVSIELETFFHEVRQNRGYKKDYKFALNAAGSGLLRRIFERNDLSFNNGLLQWSSDKPFAFPLKSKD